MPSALLLVALVCAAGTPIDACTPEVALDQLSRPCGAASPAVCLGEGETLLASADPKALRGLTVRFVTVQRGKGAR
ncbi:hypothetical protein M446_4118 [Methylobacterium sp. 4-46]|uniref:hypothetical protein n=1 Tax=unclassified Methylobacterium TaxID=2615210 RepID=UPI000165C8C2|nr:MULTISPECIES: hypothetical protein [Methylobacterium]ACA18475.1 hypothetical protein M446_4118 [Methylobacterium sp. 4-46]WFT77764.1 hypothetical protein QA634_20915 [Methylobacterium nodulans]